MNKRSKLPEPEFQPGDVVTYRPYNERSKLVVYRWTRGVYAVPDDGRIFYHLSPKGDKHVTSVTTGRCIMESKLYVPIEKENKGD